MDDTATTFANVGGLKEQIQTIKDLILFPIKYKELSKTLNMRIPRGCIFHGPPGTGKTLLASSLANECSAVGGRKVTFISRKGADILGSYVGESESRLRQVFARARLFAPSLIFFDEVDALAPARSSLSRTSFVHSSVVSVMLCEMDGVGSAGDDVFVIGATNRLEAIDPALRRPGRFDRELHFTLPDEAERREIIRVHVSRWRPPVSDETIARLAAETHGHCGADLAAMCTEALMCCLRRTQPSAGTTRVKVGRKDFARACGKMVPAAHRSATVHSRRLPTFVEPLFGGEVDAVVDNLLRRYPHAFLRGPASSPAPCPAHPACCVPRVLLTGAEDRGHTRHLGPALLHRYQHASVVALDAATVLGNGSPAAACAEACAHAASSLPCVLYAPDIAGWWPIVGEAARHVFGAFLAGLNAETALLIVATAHDDYDDLPTGLRQLFAEGDVVRVRAPRDEQRAAFFAPLILGDGNDVDKESSVYDSSEGESDSSSHDSKKQSSRTRKTVAKGKSVRKGRVTKAPKRTSKKAVLALQSSPSGPRAELLERLVAVTRGLASQPLEQAYAALSGCIARWWQHNDEQRLLAEFWMCVAAIEREVRERDEARGFGGQPDYTT